jgi:hypothetical protein
MKWGMLLLWLLLRLQSQSCLPCFPACIQQEAHQGRRRLCVSRCPWLRC